MAFYKIKVFNESERASCFLATEAKSQGEAFDIIVSKCFNTSFTPLTDQIFQITFEEALVLSKQSLNLT